MSVQLSSCLVAFLLTFSPLAPAQTTLTVAAASDLTNLEPQLTDAFRKNEPIRRDEPASLSEAKIQISFVTGASAMLTQQIENGAPYDVFLSANAQFVDRLGSSGKLLPGSLRVYALGRVAILWRDGKKHPVNELGADWVRFVALPNPKLAPYGVAAQQALERAGIWKQVQPKVVYGENVRQTLQLFESGNADAVLTSAALVQGKNPDLVPADWHRPIVQKAGVVAGSPNRNAAQKFVDFLLSPAGQAIFAQFGYGAPPAKP